MKKKEKTVEHSKAFIQKKALQRREAKEAKRIEFANTFEVVAEEKVAEDKIVEEVKEVVAEPETLSYFVVEALISSEEQRVFLFDKKISDLVKDGYIPVGGVSVVLRDNVSWKFMQALYKPI